MPSIQSTTLPNGVRVVTDTVDSVHTVALGIWCGVGTRHETMQQNGIAHMVEHMLFKGTASRNTLDIAKSIENVGGHMNAYTSREVTSYHIHLLREDMGLAIDVLADMYRHATMPPEEVERERGVILQEIGMCADTPDDIIFDHYYETAYPGQTLGAPILGTADLIKGMQRDDLMSYVRNLYTPSRTVVAAAGPVQHEEFVTLAARHFEGLPKDTDHVPLKADYKGGEHRVKKELEQSHIVLGFEGVPRGGDDYQAVKALATVLGGGMSSRLFQEIREKRGLAYSIYAFHSAYSDSGQFGVYAGTGPGDLPTLLPVVCEELLKVIDDLTEEELHRAKAQLKSGTLMARESMMSRADQIARTMIFKNKLYDLKTVTEGIDAVDMAQVKALARRIFACPPTLAALGPLEGLESYEKLKVRLAA